MFYSPKSYLFSFTIPLSHILYLLSISHVLNKQNKGIQQNPKYNVCHNGLGLIFTATPHSTPQSENEELFNTLNSQETAWSVKNRLHYSMSAGKCKTLG